ncbi:efflux RND transporter permease subunit, partial [Akkermansiaceae bacterium]|nr:efflux RND transporter permease subunit [Akkermansiaceae bacterium]
AVRLKPEIDQIVAKNQGISWIWAGYIKEQNETSNRYTWLYSLLILTLFALLAIPFKSLLQPFIVLLAVPFGVIGAYAGHVILNITPSYLSIFGIMALTGVVVNDSLVLVDFINQKRREGMDIEEAVRISGVRRFRPIFLTSITTFAGLMPLMFDRAIHAQFLKPMAVSLGFGILFATAITLLLIPTAYLALEDLDQTRIAFANHLNRLESLNPEAWPKDSLGNELEKALVILDKADEEFEQAVSHFGETRKDSLFSGQTGSFSGASSQGSFIGMIRNGFAFNLPIILLGSVAILIYHFK